MKVDMFDVLLYLFENYMSEQPHVTLPEEPGELTHALKDAGFNMPEIHKAFSWLEGLSDSLSVTSTLPCKSFRIFTDEEKARLGMQGLDFILFLEQHSVVSSQTRELILDRLLALDSFQIGLDQIKWIALIVIYHQNQGKDGLELVEDLLFLDNASQTLH